MLNANITKNGLNNNNVKIQLNTTLYILFIYSNNNHIILKY